MERINEADKLFEAKVLDKIRIAKTKNQITNTDFLSLHEQNISKKILNIEKETNFLFYLPCSGLEKAMLIVYPEKCGNIFENNIYNFENIICLIRITLPNELKGSYSHKDYLSRNNEIRYKKGKNWRHIGF